MFPAEVFTPEWIKAQRRELDQCDPMVLETCVHALTLLGLLAESGLPFLFKGGTSILLHLSQVRRLSRDIDIVCGESAATVDAIVAEIGRRPPFLRWEEDVRGARGLPQRRHFKFYYRSVVDTRWEQPVLLEVVEELAEVHTIVQKPIRTGFLIPEREVLVRVPTVESLLGDKLTAFAPSTTGVPLRNPDGTAADLQQVAKQLFDVGVLFDAATDFAQIQHSYDAVCALEAGYRGARHTREDALADTLGACLALTPVRQRDLDAFADASLLHSGFDRMSGHVTWREFNREQRRTMAARAALLVARLRDGGELDFGAVRYTGSEEQLAMLREATFANHQHRWLDDVKPINAEAYHYWHHALGPRR